MVEHEHIKAKLIITKCFLKFIVGVDPAKPDMIRLLG